MYIITNITDGHKSTLLPTKALLINFVRQIAVENGDEDLSIIRLGETLDYLENYCPNLVLTKLETPILKITGCFNCPFAVPDGEPESDQRICSEIARQNIQWEDSEGFDDYYRYPNGTPKVCPLKKQPTIIYLAK